MAANVLLALFLSLTVCAGMIGRESVAAEGAPREFQQPRQLDRLFEDFFEEDLQISTPATWIGAQRYAISEERRQKQRALHSAFLKELSEIDRGALPDRDRLNYDCFKYALALKLEGLQLIKKEYLAESKPSLGMSGLPGKRAWYAHLVKAATTTHTTPGEIFQIGKDEIKRLKKEMEQMQGKMGSNFGPYLERNAPKYGNRKDLVKAYEALGAKVSAGLPQLFGRLPTVDYEIRVVERLRGSELHGAYQHGASYDSRRAIFYVDTTDIRTRPMRLNVSLFLHEAVPGHHLQGSLHLDQSDLPRFRRHGDYVAFVEGWASYASSLGHDLGLYGDPYQRLLYLHSELSKAMDLVLDVGIHHKGWTRYQASRFIAEQTAGDVRPSTIDRLTAQPGRALAYKIGQLRISAIRSKAERALGNKFDIRAFHDELLKDGALPLDLLEAKIDAWTAGQRAGSR